MRGQLSVTVGAGGWLLSAVLGCSAPSETAPHPSGHGPQVLVVLLLSCIHRECTFIAEVCKKYIFLKFNLPASVEETKGKTYLVGGTHHPRSGTMDQEFVNFLFHGSLGVDIFQKALKGSLLLQRVSAFASETMEAPRKDWSISIRHTEAERQRFPLRANNLPVILATSVRERRHRTE